MSDSMYYSYCSAGSLPLKLFLNEGARQLAPVHVTWIPTNKCNKDCEYCSYKNRDRFLDMNLEEAVGVIRDLKELGCQAVTISGGGEPLCYPFISELIGVFFENGIQIGLATNGLLLPRLAKEDLNKLKWCRISVAEGSRLGGAYLEVLSRLDFGQLDWALSYVVGPDPDLDGIEEWVDYATVKGFTHIRLVADLNCPEQVNWELLRSRLVGKDKLVVYQDRLDARPCFRCWVCYVRPVIAPDFKMYGCCVDAYALGNGLRDHPEELCLGDARKIRDFYENRKGVEVNCARCEYWKYNDCLEVLRGGIKHERFV